MEPTLCMPKNLSLPSSRIGPAPASSCSKGEAVAAAVVLACEGAGAAFGVPFIWQSAEC